MPFQSYPGNLAMHDVVNAHKDEYITCRRSDKPRVIKKIIHELKASGARFLKPYGEFRSNDSDRWIEVDEQHIYDKISHVMRHRQRASRQALATASKSDINALLPSTSGVPTVVSLPISSASTNSRSVDGLNNFETATTIASVSPEHVSYVSSLLMQLQNLTTAASATPSNQLAMSLLPESSLLLPRFGLTGQTILANQLQQTLGLQLQQQQQQQALLEHAILAQLREQQLQRDVENRRLLAASVALSQPLQQPANAAILYELVADERIGQLLRLLGQISGNVS
jgi:hypothetical protein